MDDATSLTIAAFAGTYRKAHAAALRRLVRRAYRSDWVEHDRRSAQLVLCASMGRGSSSLAGFALAVDILSELRLGCGAHSMLLEGVTPMSDVARARESAWLGPGAISIDTPTHGLVYALAASTLGDEGRQTTVTIGWSTSRRRTAVGAAVVPSTVFDVACETQLAFASEAACQRVTVASIAAVAINTAEDVAPHRPSGSSSLSLSPSPDHQALAALARFDPDRVATLFPLVGRSTTGGTFELCGASLERLAARLRLLGDRRLAVVSVLGPARERRHVVNELLGRCGGYLPDEAADVEAVGVWASLLPMIGGAAGLALLVLEAEAAPLCQSYVSYLSPNVFYGTLAGQQPSVLDVAAVTLALQCAVSAAGVTVPAPAFTAPVCRGRWPVIFVVDRVASDENDTTQSNAGRFTQCTYASPWPVRCEAPTTCAAFAAQKCGADVWSAVSRCYTDAIETEMGALCTAAADTVNKRVTELLQVVRDNVDASDDAGFRAAYDSWMTTELAALTSNSDQPPPLSQVARVFMALVRMLKDYDHYTDTLYLHALVSLLGPVSGRSGEAVAKETSWPCTWVEEFRSDKLDLISSWKDALVLSVSSAWRFAAQVLSVREEYALWLMTELPWFCALLQRKVAAIGEHPA